MNASSLSILNKRKEKIVKKTSSKFKICMSFGWIVFCLIAGVSCRRAEQPQHEFFVEVGIDELSKVLLEQPILGKIKGIIITDANNLEEANTIKVLGNLEELERIIDKKIKAQKVVDDPVWLERITRDFLEAKPIKRGYLDDARAMFITKHKGYMIKIAADDKVVYGPDYESEEIRKHLEEIGLLAHEEPFTEPEKGSGVKLP